MHTVPESIYMSTYIYYLYTHETNLLYIQNSNMNGRETDSPQFAAGVCTSIGSWAMCLEKSKETGRYEPALICFWWIGPGKKRKLEKR